MKFSWLTLKNLKDVYTLEKSARLSERNTSLLLKVRVMCRGAGCKEIGVGSRLEVNGGIPCAFSQGR